MKKLTVIACYCMIVFCHAGCKNSGNTQNKSSDHESDADPGLIRFINSIRAVDNHAHPNTVDPVDNGSDALPLDGLGAIELPARVRAHSRVWVNAAKALYGFRDSVLQEKDFDFLAVAAENL